MAKTDIWMPLYIGDYLAATTHLNATESGGYLHLLMHQWKNGSLPADTELLRRIARIDTDAWSNAWAMLAPFFSFATGVPMQMRLEEIRADWDAKKAKAVTKAASAASARWAGHAPSNAPGNASSSGQALLKECPSSSPSPSPKKEQKQAPAVPSFALPEWVESSAWQGYEEMRTKQRKPMTDRARMLAVADLARLRDAGHSPTLVLNQSVMHGWQGLFAPKGDAAQETRQGATVGMRKVPDVTEDDRSVTVSFWRELRQRGSPQYEREAPAWVKQELGKEAMQARRVA